LFQTKSLMLFCKIATLCSLLFVAACGFEPLYYSTQSSRNPGPLLTTVKINAIADREGQTLRNNLVEKLNPQGEPENPRYTLSVKLTEAQKDLGIESDTSATFSRLQVSGSFALRNLETGNTVFRGISQSSVSFNVVDSPYGEFAAENSARDRALGQISEDIYIRLGTYFKTAPYKRGVDYR